MELLVVLAGYGLVLLVGLALTVFWVVALIDCLMRRFDEPVTKLIWVVVIVFLHALGALIYWFIGRPAGQR